MSDQAPQVGQKLGKYQLEKTIGEGAMGSVFLAHDALLDRRVALKTIALIYAGDPHFKARFLREARTLAKLNHPNVVQIYDVHDGDNSKDASLGTIPFLVTEFVAGQDLYNIIKKHGRLPWGRACLLTRQIAQGLNAAAESDIVHRDVKPGNILVAAGDLAKVLDFGLAKPLIGDQSLTQAEVVMGTPDYMAPEQAMGRPIDWRADLYALGCTLYQMLVGEAPYGKGAPAEICARHVYDPFPDIRDKQPDLPPRLVSVLGGMVAKDAAARLASYGELVDGLDGLVNPGRDRERLTVAVTIDSGKQQGLRVLLSDRPLLIGRLPECDISLDDPRSSRKHAAVQHGSEGVEVRDLGSRNGILVNGRNVTLSLLQDGDRLQVGDTILRIAVTRSPAPIARHTSPGLSAPPEIEVTDQRPVPNLEDIAIDEASVFLAGPDQQASPWREDDLKRVVSGSAANRLVDANRMSKPELLRYRRLEVVALRFNLTGTVRLADRLEPVELARRLNACLDTLVKIVFAQQGAIDTLTGDSVLAIFGAPIEIADAPSKAAAAALLGVRTVVHQQKGEPQDQRLGVRAGVGFGPVVAGLFGTRERRDYGVLGLAAELARSLGSLAPAGTVLCSSEIVDQLAPSFTAVPRADVSMCLHGQEVSVYELGGMR